MHLYLRANKNIRIESNLSLRVSETNKVLTERINIPEDIADMFLVHIQRMHTTLERNPEMESDLRSESYEKTIIQH